MANGRRILIFIFLISFAIRLIAAIVYLNFDSQTPSMDRQPFLPFGEDSNNIRKVVGDRDGYNTVAQNILAYGKIGRVPGRGPSVPPPLYPIFLAICYSVFGYNIFAFFIPHIILASINSIFILRLGQQVFSNRVGIMASIFYAFNPHFIISSIQLYSETLYFFLILSLFLLCQKLLLKSTPKYAISIGIFMALAALCRSAFFAFIPFIFIWLIIVFYHERRKMLISASIIFCLFLLVYGTWIIGNYKAFPRILFFEISRSVWWETNWLPSDINKVTEYRNKYKDGYTAFINWVKENPKQYFRLCTRRLKTFLFKPYADGVSFRHKVVSSLIFFTIYPLGYLGIAKAFRERKRIATLTLLFISSTIILHVLTSIEGELRYRLPVELFITMFAAYGLSIALNFFSFQTN